MKFTVETKDAPNARPRYGYHNSICTITFEPNQLTEDGQKIIVELFREFKAKSNMWCYAAKLVPQADKPTYVFEYGYDSGD
jgi:hypothetical protein